MSKYGIERDGPDVLVKAPPAVIHSVAKGVHRAHLLEAPSAEEEVLILKAELYDQRRQLNEARDFASNMALAALCFIRTLVEHDIWAKDTETVTLPAERLRRMRGYSVEMTPLNGSLTLRVRERVPQPVIWEP